MAQLKLQVSKLGNLVSIGESGHVHLNNENISYVPMGYNTKIITDRIKLSRMEFSLHKLQTGISFKATFLISVKKYGLDDY